MVALHKDLSDEFSGGFSGGFYGGFCGGFLRARTLYKTSGFATRKIHREIPRKIERNTAAPLFNSKQNTTLQCWMPPLLYTPANLAIYSEIVAIAICSSRSIHRIALRAPAST
eukprot:426867-Amphidinium_carterae.1